MTPQELVAKTIQAEASKDSTDFVEVFHRGENRKTKVSFGDFRLIEKDSLDGKQLEDSISFLDMITPFISRGDGITYDGVTYNVEYFMPVGNNIYKVFAIKTTRMGSSSKVRVTK